MTSENIKNSNGPASFVTLVSHFLDFLTVAIHTILYERKIYPHDSFLSARKYNYPVRQSRHPDLCDWINDSINYIEKELMDGTIKAISVVIYSPQDEALERFVFDLQLFPALDRQHWYTEFPPDTDMNIANMEEQFRAVMAKLAYCHQHLDPLPINCTFNIAIELRDNSEPPINQSQKWTATEQNTTGVSITPLRLVDVGPMRFEMWVEESQAKLDKLDIRDIQDIIPH